MAGARVHFGTNVPLLQSPITLSAFENETNKHQLSQRAQPKFSQNSDWAQLISSGLQDFFQVLTPHGRIRHVSDSCKAIVGHECRQLVGRIIYDFIHPDDLEVFTKEIQEILLYGVPVRLIYRFRSSSREWVVLESQCSIDRAPNPGSAPRDLIIMARPYLTKTNVLLDSFLEHKIVHSTLLQEKARLERESSLEDSDDESEPQHSAVDTKLTGSHIQPQPSRVKLHVQIDITCLQPAAESAVGPASFVTSPQDQDTPENPIDNLEVIGDQGIPFSRTRVPWTKSSTSRKKAQKRVKQDHMCMFCGSSKSPEWRKGPEGPKTLCNKCGLRWSKSSRQMNA